jgi:hypothetical protein
MASIEVIRTKIVAPNHTGNRKLAGMKILFVESYDNQRLVYQSECFYF